MKELAGKKDSGFPITNVGNDRRGIGNGERGLFVWKREMLDDVLENHEATGFVPADGHNPAAPFPVMPASPLPVIPASFFPAFPQSPSRPSRMPPSCHSRGF